VAGVTRTFDYLVPPELDASVAIGTLVRVVLNGRRVGGWVVADDVVPPPDVTLKPLAHVTGMGPPAEVVDLAGWAAWRWAGRPRHLLRAASPDGAVKGLPPPAAASRAAAVGDDHGAAEALARERTVLRLPPAADVVPLVVAAARRGTTLVVAPDHAAAAALGGRLRRAGVPVAVLPRGWAQAAAGGGVVVGARGTAWAPAPDLAAVLVLDEHEEAHQEEGSPTWSARDVAAERARRAGVPCVLTSPCPSLEALAWGDLQVPARTVERAGWPVVDVVDRRSEDPRKADLYSSRLVDLIRSSAPEPGRPVVCVLNRKGRARLLVCASCAELARCERCGATVAVTPDGALRCARCATERPSVCLHCGSAHLKQRRLGVTRAREDLERLARRPVGEVTGEDAPGSPLPDAPVLVGTEAVLRRVERAAAVAFLDLDAELLAPRYRAAEEAMALVARAARLLGGKAAGGRLLLQTKLPRHEVVQAALLADPGRVADAELERRRALLLPPVAALAHVAGAGAEVFARAAAEHPGVTALGPAAGDWLLRAADHAALCDALAATPRPPGRLRVAVDPRRV
jgi:primosomal protein N' (replication factor Y)